MCASAAFSYIVYSYAVLCYPVHRVSSVSVLRLPHSASEIIFRISNDEAGGKRKRANGSSQQSKERDPCVRRRDELASLINELSAEAVLLMVRPSTCDSWQRPLPSRLAPPPAWPARRDATRSVVSPALNRASS
jgi:hypothetical protein